MSVTDSCEPIQCRGSCGRSWSKNGWNYGVDWGVKHNYTCSRCIEAAVEDVDRQGRLFQ